MSAHSDAERYVTSDELKAELPFSADDFPTLTDAEFQQALQRALDAASECVEEWSNTRFVPTTVTETVVRAGSAPPDVLALPSIPVISVTSVTVDGTQLAAADWVLVDDELRLTGSASIQSWPTDPTKAATVEWTYGYENVPSRIEGAIIRLARHTLDLIEIDGISSDDDGYDYRPPSEIRDEVRSVVEPYAVTPPGKSGGSDSGGEATIRASIL